MGTIVLRNSDSAVMLRVEHHATNGRCTLFVSRPVGSSYSEYKVADLSEGEAEQLAHDLLRMPPMWRFGANRGLSVHTSHGEMKPAEEIATDPKVAEAILRGDKLL